ncbi:MAG: hypothetical protein APF77_21725 [Clostridia bacterium BRH_c25]|nr:MAG: hypothetical protein APF77_21725 [Clostridia bacterium BRH_c25]
MGLSADASLFTTLAIIFTTGLLSSLSPCTLPTIVLIIGYVSGKVENSKLKSFTVTLAFTLGIAFTLTILGAFAGIAGKLLLQTKAFYYVVAGILLVMGLWMLKVLNINPKGNFDLATPQRGSGVLGAFLLGIPFGIAASPCTLPITGSVLTYSAIKGSAIYGMLMMFTYAIGKSIPLIIVGTFTGILKNLGGLSKYQTVFEKVGGIILVLLAFYFIWIA